MPCYVMESEELTFGQRYGFIPLGSRVYLFLPEDFSIDAALRGNVSSDSLVFGHF
jgi:hypothetical protein